MKNITFEDYLFSKCFKEPLTEQEKEVALNNNIISHDRYVKCAIEFAKLKVTEALQCVSENVKQEYIKISKEAKEIAIDFTLWQITADCDWMLNDKDDWEHIFDKTKDNITTEELFKEYIKFRNER